MKILSARATGVYVAVFAIALTSHDFARADTTARIEWLVPAPEDCIDSRAIERTIESRLGRAVFVTTPDAVVIHASFLEVPAGKSVQLEVRSAIGEPLGGRELAVASCEELTASLPVVIAVLLDLELPPAAPPPAAAADQAQSPPASPEPSPDGAPNLSFGLAISAQLTLADDLGVGTGAALQLSAAFASVFEIHVWGDVQPTNETRGSPAVAVQSQSIGLAFCVKSALFDALSGAVCVGGGAQHLRARGVDFDENLPDARWLAVSRAVVRLEYPVMVWLSARFETGIALPLQRPRYGFDDADGRTVVYQPSPGWLSQLGLSVLWP